MHLVVTPPVESITPQRMLLGSNFKIGPATDTWYEVSSGWSSNPTYPAVVTGNALQVTGDATVAVTVNWTLDTTFSAPAYVRVLRNGTVVYESTARTADGGYVESFSLTVADGDLLTIQAKLTGSFTAVYVMNGSYLDIR
ncbi:hypothetical protein L5I01_17585 [Gordonia sp. HY442]|uniref:hypothetical protein n=1 Tax=Gordonia zhenghanii TaxID=2911516 RepID=UPI001F38AFCF|nr:hypothetical protein [Gordonia zhenghanii]MCF8605169.1 hypothetical protein [Gordonia zhenghanii]